MREPEPGEFPLDPDAGSRSERPLYDINRADLHMAYWTLLDVLTVGCSNTLKKLGLIATWEHTWTNILKRKVGRESS